MKRDGKVQLSYKNNNEIRGSDIQSSIQSSKNFKQSRNRIPNGSYRSRIKQETSYLNQSKRNISPSMSAVTNRTEQHFKEMEHVILGENHNLKDHNNFLVSQISSMFQKERKYKKQLALRRQKISQLESINLHLTNQMHLLICNIVSEIQRIQKLLNSEKQKHYDEMLIISQSESRQKSLSYIGSETESIITHDLQNLKSKINDIMLQNNPSPDKCYNYKQSKLLKDPQQKFNKNSQTITKQTSFRNSGLNNDKQEQFETYLPTNLLTDKKQTRKFPPRKK